MTSFKGFFTLKEKAYKKSVNGFLPKSVVIPLAQDSCDECECLVKPGDRVQEGQLIGQSKFEGKRFDTNIYSSVPGIVKGIEHCPTPDGHYSKAVRIDVNGSFTFLGKKKEKNQWEKISPSLITEYIAESGVINTFNTSSPEPLAEQIYRFTQSKASLLIVRLFDDDSTRIADTVSSRLFFEEVTEAAEIVKKAAGCDSIVFVCDKKFVKNEELSNLKNYLLVNVDTKMFPSGFYEQIIKVVKKASSESIYKNVSKDDLFIDATTLMEVYRTVNYKMPVVDRFVHVSGSCLPISGMVKVCVGTTLRFLAEQFGGFVKQPAAIIVNGLVLGYSASSLDAPVTKYVKSVVFLPVTRRPVQHNSECIRCGNCRRACPLGLFPDVLYRHACGGLNASKDYIKTAQICSNCGLCNLYCPSRLPISQRIAELKSGKSNSGDRYEIY